MCHTINTYKESTKKNYVKIKKGWGNKCIVFVKQSKNVANKTLCKRRKIKYLFKSLTKNKNRLKILLINVYIKQPDSIHF